MGCKICLWSQILEDKLGGTAAYFDSLEIRKIIYTTNAIESANSGIRKYTKTKTVLPDDQAVLKAVYLALSNIQLKWTSYRVIYYSIFPGNHCLFHPLFLLFTFNYNL